MKLDLIQRYITQYGDYLRTLRFLDEDYEWEILANFQKEWNDNEADFAAMYDRSISSDRNRKHWKSPGYEPKKMMLNFAREQPDSTRTVFRDLFDETKAPENRIDRFVYYCDAMLVAWRGRHRDRVENNHYHTNYRAVFFYLAMKYPAKYTLYDFEAFRATLKAIGAKDIPQAEDPERYVKVSRTLWNFLSKDPQLGQQYNRLLVSKHCFRGETMLPVVGFYRFVASLK